MSSLIESEVIDRLRTSLRSAADLCVKLAKLPAQGKNYSKLVEDLKLIEGAARQMGSFRLDMRWMRFGWEMAKFHQRIGDCVRSHAAREIFLKFATMLGDALKEADVLRSAKTGKRGPILPRMAAVHRDTRPVYVKRPSGLLLPAA